VRGAPDPMKPNVLIYEPVGKELKLVEVEWLVSNASFHQKHGHVSRMACITPVCAFALQFSRCSFAHSLKASTIASFDTNDFGHAEGIDIVVKLGGSLMSFIASPFVMA
ncbi:MAG: hypothetical protein WB019_08520, partial [Pseudolabrys sp.]